MDRDTRGWCKLDTPRFMSALLNSAQCKPATCLYTAEEYFDLYESVLKSLAHQFAHVKKIKIRRQKLAPWMDCECQQLRHQSRLQSVDTEGQDIQLIDLHGLKTRGRVTVSIDRRSARFGQIGCRSQQVNHRSYSAAGAKSSNTETARLKEQAGQPQMLLGCRSKHVNQIRCSAAGASRSTTEAVMFNHYQPRIRQG